MNKDILGKEYEAFEVPVERGKIREFAQAAFDDNPIYFDEEYAGKTKSGCIIAPPHFVTDIAHAYDHWWQILGELNVKPGHSAQAEEEYIYFKPIFVGDVLTGEEKIVDFYEKTSRRGGKITFAVIETTFHNQNGEKVVVDRKTTMETSDLVG